MKKRETLLEAGDYVRFAPEFVAYFAEKNGWSEAERVGYERTKGCVSLVKGDGTVDVRYLYTFVAGPHGDAAGVDNVLAAHLVTYQPTTADLLWGEDFPKDKDGWACSTDDSDAVERWIRLHPDADLFDTIVAENIVEDDPDWVDDEWTMERVGSALRQLVRMGVLRDEGTLSAGAFFSLLKDEQTVPESEAAQYLRGDDRPSVADDDTDDEMLAIVACRDGKPFDGAEVTRVETGETEGVFLTAQTYVALLRLHRAVSDLKAADLIPDNLGI